MPRPVHNPAIEPAIEALDQLSGRDRTMVLQGMSIALQAINVAQQDIVDVISHYDSTHPPHT